MRPEIRDLKPTVWIGKKGCTDVVLEEILHQLKVRSVIKIRFLQHAEMDVGTIAEATEAQVLDVRGRTAILARSEQSTGKPRARNI